MGVGEGNKLREGKGPVIPRLTPQLTGKAIHIIEFLWVAPPIAPHPWKAATVTIATRTGLGDRIPDKTRMCAPGAPKNHLSPGASSSFPHPVHPLTEQCGQRATQHHSCQSHPQRQPAGDVGLQWWLS